LNTKKEVQKSRYMIILFFTFFFASSVAEMHHFYAALPPGNNLDAAPAPVTALTLLYSKEKI
jgi:hypothetical protein